MSPLPRASVIISVYNNIRFLNLVLAGFERQTEPNFEIIISDDGSGEAFCSELQKLMAQSPLSIRHNWQPDEGFRKNKALNQSVRMARASYLIFVDGDCIPHPGFVAGHLSQAAPGICLSGRRMDLSPAITNSLTPEAIREGALQSAGMHLKMLGHFISGRLGHYRNGLCLPEGPLRRYLNRKYRGLLGANFSLYRSDLLAINGFDERYTQPTFGEDSDVELRLGLSGVCIRPVLHIAVLYHCWHKALPRPEGSRQLYEQAVREARPFTPYGIDQGV